MHIRPYWIRMVRHNVLYSLPQANRPHRHGPHARIPFECVFGYDRHSAAQRLSTLASRHRHRESHRRQRTEWGSFGGIHELNNSYTRIALQFTCTQRFGRYVYIWVVISSRFISDRVSLSLFCPISTVFRHMHDCDEIPIKKPPCGRPKFWRSWNKNNTRKSVKIPTIKKHSIGI